LKTATTIHRQKNQKKLFALRGEISREFGRLNSHSKLINSVVNSKK